eukprot:scaffold6460_cov130-Isochrysis_galbana.AAC.3
MDGGGGCLAQGLLVHYDVDARVEQQTDEGERLYREVRRRPPLQQLQHGVEQLIVFGEVVDVAPEPERSTRLRRGRLAKKPPARPLDAASPHNLEARAQRHNERADTKHHVVGCLEPLRVEAAESSHNRIEQHDQQYVAGTRDKWGSHVAQGCGTPVEAMVELVVLRRRARGHAAPPVLAPK